MGNFPFGDTSKFTLEICCSDLKSARVAEKNGADHIELCQNIEQGGVTPSYGLIKKRVEKLRMPVHVLIRPRPGHFAYGREELPTMMEDVAICRELGCAGVVVGFAGGIYNVNQIYTELVVGAAGDMSVTFHRAFDDILGAFGAEAFALEKVIEAGCKRLLTSGGEDTAEHGMDQIRHLVERAGGRISVMAEAGVNLENVKKIIQHTGVREVHTTAKQVRKQIGKSERKGLFEADEIVVDGKVVAKMVEALESIDVESLPSISPAQRSKK